VFVAVVVSMLGAMSYGICGASIVGSMFGPLAAVVRLSKLDELHTDPGKGIDIVQKATRSAILPLTFAIAAGTGVAYFTYDFLEDTWCYVVH